ncbi:MAG: HNH endonuclease [Bryobacteraceae bacterium]
MPVCPPTFRHRGARTKREARVEYDQRRGSARERGYGARWDKASAGFKRSHPLCLGCEAVDRVEAATITDHVIPHRGDMVTFWDSTHWQPACEWHHSVVKQKLEAMYEQRRATTADLWLNSNKAIELTRRLRSGGGV